MPSTPRRDSRYSYHRASSWPKTVCCMLRPIPLPQRHTQSRYHSCTCGQRGQGGVFADQAGRQRKVFWSSVFNAPKHLFLPIDSTADSFVTSVRINNVIPRGISRAVEDFRCGRFELHSNSQAFELISLALDTSFFASFSSRWNKWSAAGLPRSRVVYGML